jgi:hypothetical protein
VIRFDIITKIDRTITIGIHVGHNFSVDFGDIETVPFTFTFWDVEFTWAIDISVFWTVSISPFIFTLDNTSVDFTGIKISIKIGITIVNQDLIVIGINVISRFNRIRVVGIIVGHDFNSNVFDIFTIPSTWTVVFWIWVFTINITIFWTVSSSPFIFNND